MKDLQIKKYLSGDLEKICKEKTKRKIIRKFEFGTGLPFNRRIDLNWITIHLSLV